MKRLVIFVVLFLCAASLQAAQLYYQFPDATKLKDNDRILVYQNNSGNRNITGAKLKTEALGGDGPLVKQVTKTNRYARIAEYKNYSGQITSYITANGAMVIGGRTPQPLSVASVFPPNGFVGYSTSKHPNLMLNKSMFETGTDSNGFPMLPAGVFALVGQTLNATLCTGQSIDVVQCTNNWTLYGAVLATNTTYTLRFYRQALVQTDGETTSNCGTAMTDMGGYCQSTFTTGSR